MSFVAAAAAISQEITFPPHRGQCLILAGFCLAAQRQVVRDET